MASQDLYIEYLKEMHRDELRLMAKNQEITGFSRMDKPELIVELLDAKIRRASAFVIKQACLWGRGGEERVMPLYQAVLELESLYDAREEWDQLWKQRQEKELNA